MHAYSIEPCGCGIYGGRPVAVAVGAAAAAPAAGCSTCAAAAARAVAAPRVATAGLGAVVREAGHPRATLPFLAGSLPEVKRLARASRRRVPHLDVGCHDIICPSCCHPSTDGSSSMVNPNTPPYIFLIVCELRFDNEQ